MVDQVMTAVVVVAAGTRIYVEAVIGKRGKNVEEVFRVVPRVAATVRYRSGELECGQWQASVITDRCIVLMDDESIEKRWCGPRSKGCKKHVARVM